MKPKIFPQPRKLYESSVIVEETDNPYLIKVVSESRKKGKFPKIFAKIDYLGLKLTLFRFKININFKPK